MLQSFSGIKRRAQRNFINSLGFKTNRRLLVIESDDWGSIRMPSKEAYEYLIKVKSISANDPFARYDSLASEDDLSALFDTLCSFKDFKGNQPVITANCVIANPDFDKIRQSNFSEYHFELFLETLKRYPKHSNAFSIWKQGIEKKLFLPQYHGREHINVSLWMEKLINGSMEFLHAFNKNTFATDHKIAAAFDLHSKIEIDEAKQILQQGYDLFSGIFGYNSDSFIAPNYTWNINVEEALNQKGVKIIQGSYRQNVPVFGKRSIRKKFHFTGQKNRFSQVYLVRNCLFEPSISPNVDYVSACLRHISNAFSWRKPAIIGTHRLNYIGYLDEKNRFDNLKKLKDILNYTLKTWPDVEFLSTKDLGNIILQNSDK